MKNGTHPCFKVDISAFLDKQSTNACIAVVGSNVQRSKAALHSQHNNTTLRNVHTTVRILHFKLTTGVLRMLVVRRHAQFFFEIYLSLRSVDSITTSSKMPFFGSEIKIADNIPDNNFN